MKDLADRLYDFSAGWESITPTAPEHYSGQIMAEAADEIRQLRVALKPFADYAKKTDANYTSQGYPDACPLGLKPEIDGTKEIIHLGDCRNARRILENAQ